MNIYSGSPIPEPSDILVGHFILHPNPNEGEPTLLSYGTDWDESLLSKKEASEIVRQGMTEEWAKDIAEKFIDHGAAMLHFYATPDGISVDDCALNCPASLEARALLAPTKGDAS